ncbi:MAG TPA: peptidylprolyl isomerase [Oscillospiraceae bacterium]|nr:peptidylprolyl isomerase [Oscillospiraceae bacterium]HNW05330.1 peptidylprolyl isomerase [Oscillospiraceae bacterium]
MKKLIAILLAALMLSMSLSGCEISRQLGEESGAEDGQSGESGEPAVDPAVYDDVCVTAGGREFTVAEMDFLYRKLLWSVYNSLYSNYGDSVSGILDPTKSLDEQYYTQDVSWNDYLTQYTLYSLKSVAALLNEAEAQSYAYSEDVAESVAAQKTNLTDAAQQVGLTEEAYLTETYGPAATAEVFERVVTLIAQATEYSNFRRDALALTDEEIRAAYEAESYLYDTVSFRFAFFSGAPAEEESESAAEASSQAAESEAAADPALMAQAEEKANALAAAKTEEEFVAAVLAGAPEEDKEYYETDEATLIEDLAYGDVPETFSGWLFQEGHALGDTTVIESDSGYYVFFFLDRDSPDYATVNVRHILFQPETDESGIASDENWAAAEAEAEAALAEYKAGEQTEAAFATLAALRSEDGGTKANGGLCENVYKGQMVTAFDDWCYDETRAPGGTGIVKSTYGYHVMYFVGEGQNYLTAYLGDQMAQDQFDGWMSGLTDATEAVTNDSFAYVGHTL